MLAQNSQCRNCGAINVNRTTRPFRGTDVFTNYRHNKALLKEEVMRYPEMLYLAFTNPSVSFSSQGKQYRMVLIESEREQGWIKKLLQKVRLVPRARPLELICEDVQGAIEDLQSSGVDSIGSLLPDALAFIQHRYRHIDSVMLSVIPHKGVTVIFV